MGPYLHCVDGLVWLMSDNVWKSRMRLVFLWGFWANLRGLGQIYEAFGQIYEAFEQIYEAFRQNLWAIRMWHWLVISYPLCCDHEHARFTLPRVCSGAWVLPCWLKLNISIYWLCFIRISAPAFTTYVLVLLCIGLRHSFFHFRWWF